jgi:hypothetical protein
MLRIGRSAGLLPKYAEFQEFLKLVVYGRLSETERVLVGNDEVKTLNLLKIQSMPYGNIWITCNITSCSPPSRRNDDASSLVSYKN